MKHNRFFLLLATAALMAVFQVSAFADLTALQNIVDGFHYDFMAVNVPGSLTNERGDIVGEITYREILGSNPNNRPDLSAYSSLTKNEDTYDFYFQTFCVAPGVHFNALEENHGTLNLSKFSDTVYISVTSQGNAINLGIAYLYKEFASGNLVGLYDYTGASQSSSAAQLQDAIWFLLCETYTGRKGEYTELMFDKSTNWSNNDFLQLLLTKEAESFWKELYNLEDSYGSLMGDYKVFVVNNAVENIPEGTMVAFGGPQNVRQDGLYLARTGSTHTPEPASILLWTLGSLGAAGMAYRKRRNSAK
jgi:hypothetical protein